jgi:NADP-dependent 3-hydroxy acid dehydrogenase YdfG
MNRTNDLHGRVAVITGASSGMGRATALRLASHGASVALLARRESALRELAADIGRAGGTALPVTVDVTDAMALQTAADIVAREFGAADLVFNNAGIMLPGAIETQPFSEWQQQIDLNITGAMQVIRAFLPQLQAATAQGKVVDLINTSSIAGQYVYSNFAVYSATKAYISHLNIRVSMLEPGITETELQGHFTFQGATDWIANARQSIEFLKADDIARVVAFLAAQPPHMNLQQVVIMPTREGI